ncbi:MAG: c-type cytochrome [Alphaproteobacteria bacterium]|nr:c-type cytochrome [Alphaproteobacteria bacterium]
MKKYAFLAAMVAASITAGHAQAAALVGNVSNGHAVFEQTCHLCHSLDHNKIGPVLDGVYGRKAGTAAGFNYSPGVKSSKIVWNDETLDKWLSGPSQLIPGARMTIRVTDPQKRADVIAYLKSLGAKK